MYSDCFPRKLCYSFFSVFRVLILRLLYILPFTVFFVLLILFFILIKKKTKKILYICYCYLLNDIFILDMYFVYEYCVLCSDTVID